MGLKKRWFKKNIFIYVFIYIYIYKSIWVSIGSQLRDSVPPALSNTQSVCTIQSIGNTAYKVLGTQHTMYWKHNTQGIGQTAHNVLEVQHTKYWVHSTQCIGNTTQKVLGRQHTMYWKHNTQSIVQTAHNVLETQHTRYLVNSTQDVEQRASNMLGLFVVVFASLQYLRSYHDGYPFVTVPHRESRPLTPSYYKAMCEILEGNV